ncbi:MAG TPA: hypothetical protein PLO84_01355 [Thermotogota bacterium]|nr:hypothetical protein [Thermotogota bacterium]
MKRLLFVLIAISVVLFAIGCTQLPNIVFTINGVVVSGTQLAEKVGEIINAGVGPKDITVEIQAEESASVGATITVYAGVADPVQIVAQSNNLSLPLSWQDAQPGTYAVRVQIQSTSGVNENYYFTLIVDSEIRVTRILVNDRIIPDDQTVVMVDPKEVVVMAETNDPDVQTKAYLNGNEKTNPCTFTALPNTTYEITYEFTNQYETVEKKLTIQSRVSDLKIIDLLVDGIQLDNAATKTFINEGPTSVFAEANESGATFTVDVREADGTAVRVLSSRGIDYNFVAESNKSYEITVRAYKDVTEVERIIHTQVLQGIAVRSNSDSIVAVGNESSDPSTLKLYVSSVDVDFVEAWLQLPDGHPNSNPNMKRLGTANVMADGTAEFDVDPFDTEFLTGIPGTYIFWVRPLGEEDFSASVTVNLYDSDLVLELSDVGFVNKEIYTTEDYHRFQVDGSLFPGVKARQTRWDLEIINPSGNVVLPVPYTKSQVSGTINATMPGTLTTTIPDMETNPLFRFNENGLYTVNLTASGDFGNIRISGSDQILIHYSGEDPLKIENILINGMRISEETDEVAVNLGNNTIFADTNYSDSEVTIDIVPLTTIVRRGSVSEDFTTEAGKEYTATIRAEKDSESVERVIRLIVKQGLDIDLSVPRVIVTDETEQVSAPQAVIGSLSSSEIHTAEVYLELPEGHPNGSGLIGPIFEETDVSPDNVATFSVDPFNHSQIAGVEGDYVFYAKPFGEDFSASETLNVYVAAVDATIQDSEFINPDDGSTDTYHQFTVAGQVYPGIYAGATSWSIMVRDPLGNTVSFIQGSGPASGKCDQAIPGSLSTSIATDQKTGLVKMTETGTYTAYLTLSALFNNTGAEIEQTVTKEFYYESVNDLEIEEIFVNERLLNPSDEGTQIVLEPGRVNIYAAANYVDAVLTMSIEKEEIPMASSARGKVFAFDGVAGIIYNITLTAQKGTSQTTYSFSVRIPQDIILTLNGAPAVIVDNTHCSPTQTILNIFAEDYPNQVIEIWLTVPTANPLNADGRTKYGEVAVDATGEGTLNVDVFDTTFDGIEGTYEFFARVAGSSQFVASKVFELYRAWTTADIHDEACASDTTYTSSAYHKFDVSARTFPGKLATEKTWTITISGANGGTAEIVPLSEGALNGTVDVESEGTLTTKTADGLKSALVRLSQTDVYTATLTVVQRFESGEVLTVTDSQIIHYEAVPPTATLTVLQPQNHVVNQKQPLILLINAQDDLAIGDVNTSVELGTLLSEEVYTSPDGLTYIATEVYLFGNVDGASSTINVTAYDKAGLSVQQTDRVFVDVVAPEIEEASGSVHFINETPAATEIDYCTDFHIATVSIHFNDPDSLLQSTETAIVKNSDSEYTVYATYSAKDDVAEGIVEKIITATDTAGNAASLTVVLNVDTMGPNPVTPINGMIVFGEQADYVQLPFHEQINPETLVATLTIGNLSYSIESDKTEYVAGDPYIYRTYYNCDLTTNPQPTIDIFVKDLYDNSSYHTDLPVNVYTNSSAER